MSRHSHPELLTNDQRRQMAMSLAARSELASYRISVTDKRGASYNMIRVFRGPLACMAWVRSQQFHNVSITPLI